MSCRPMREDDLLLLWRDGRVREGTPGSPAGSGPAYRQTREQITAAVGRTAAGRSVGSTPDGPGTHRCESLPTGFPVNLR